jgi:phenylacetic acid degradation operon negative regulatory protein
MDKQASPAKAALEKLIGILHGQGRVRVWSLVITIFGDAIVPRGGDVPLQVLQSVMERLRIESGALRTAMSRLASEGWVERRRDGRNSYYRLAEQGRHAFDEATQRIYAAGPPEWDGEWSVAIAMDAAATSQAGEWIEGKGFQAFGNGTWLRADTAAVPELKGVPEGLLLIKGRALRQPENIGVVVGGAVVASAYGDFAKAIAPLVNALDRGDRLEGIDALAARTLLIHDWRRIVLKSPPLPADLLPPDWPGENARALVKRVYAKLAGPSEEWLAQAGLPPLRDPAGFSSRFGIVPRIRREEI